MRVKWNRFALQDVAGTSITGEFVASRHEGRGGSILGDIIRISTRILGVTVASSFRRIFGILGAVQVLVVKLEEVANRLPMPDVTKLSLFLEELIPIRLGIPLVAPGCKASVKFKIQCCC
jgi:hypothetical protein